MDRIDLHVDVPPVKYGELTAAKRGEQSSDVRKRVIKAREIQAVRFSGQQGLFCNADMGSRAIKEFCSIDDAGSTLLKTAMSKLGLSARAYDRILKVARTIADLNSSKSIESSHLGEAIQYRTLDRNLFLL